MPPPRKHLFYDDYSEGAHPEVLKAIAEANDGQQAGYGRDAYCELARTRLVTELGVDADVHFVTGGTQANIVCLASMLRPYEGVIAASTAHIHVHETGAIEATGHKLIVAGTADGKLTPASIDTAMLAHEDEHTVKPRVVFVSQATELGTVYTQQELAGLVEHAHALGLLVYLDGARLAMACGAMTPQATLSDIAATGVDMLYIGATKNGGLLGEAVAIINADLREDFRYVLKQRGGLLAKGRVLGAQFARFFDGDGLWYELGHKANQRARELALGLSAAGVRLHAPQESNLVFAVMPESMAAALETDYGFYHRGITGDGDVVVRLVCSWATDPDAVAGLLGAVERSL
jgi:threonine aldolase